ncbi:class I SAM-dependent methyltransferase [Prescottella agglutinans]|uniref:SAM-dependent methyltransferase n=1 Tax=Prescottella agglutinans TaxID=1644129 RepID=A0ABT6MH22_9NOCA|nr:class I SAM-dependent methyltransferase [Prescottella agglutinans]MDH6283175.1 SAM-dependent methyltransferase [Prescottella agglutinans]
MASGAEPTKNWFEHGGQAYARFRPEYPDELSAFLASAAPSRGTAVDVGCGTGQLTVQLAAHFDVVVGVDPSTEQIANASPSDGVRYVDGPAERLPLPDHSASLVTAAQSAHWFDLPAFYREVRRITVDHAVVALISYGVLGFDHDRIDARFQRFYRDEIGPYWPAERRLVDSGYADIDFPFDEQPTPPLQIRKDWNLPELLGYISTWSAVRRARDAGREDVLEAFATDLTALWGDAPTARAVTWPVNMRVGKIR